MPIDAVARIDRNDARSVPIAVEFVNTPAQSNVEQERWLAVLNFLIEAGREAEGK
jgi:RNAse (barnase) inhibitor barstar